MQVKQDGWDVIIVGTGPSGATVAKELAKRKQSVLILEKGQDDYAINIPRMLINKEMMFIGKGRTLVRGIRTGGSSVLYYGTAYEPPAELFLKYGINLTAEINELKKDLPIAQLDDALIGPAAQKVMASAVDLGYPWRKLDKFIYQELCSPGHFPYEAQWNSTRYVDEAVNAGAVILNGAAVKKVIIAGQEAVGVEYTYNGEHRTAYAAQIVLAAFRPHAKNAVH